MSADLPLCFDSSALVERVRPEPESEALLARSRERSVSALVRTRFRAEVDGGRESRHFERTWSLTSST
jgi:hypothetical protein